MKKNETKIIGFALIGIIFMLMVIPLIFAEDCLDPQYKTVKPGETLSSIWQSFRNVLSYAQFLSINPSIPASGIVPGIVLEVCNRRDASRISTLTVDSDIGSKTLAEFLGLTLGSEINNKDTYPSKLPPSVYVNGNKLDLVWDESRRKWDYRDQNEEHFSVNGGEIIYLSNPTPAPTDKVDTLRVSKNIGTKTLAEEIASFYRESVSSKSASKLPKVVYVNGVKLNLVWDLQNNVWDYKTESGKHFKVYGGEVVYLSDYISQMGPTNPDTFVIRSNIGLKTIADELSTRYSENIFSEQGYPSKLPSIVYVNGVKLNLVWDDSLKKWDYHDLTGAHFKVYGGEIVRMDFTNVPKTQKTTTVSCEKTCAVSGRSVELCNKRQCPNEKCYWDGNSCELYSLTLKSNLGSRDTVATEVAAYYQESVSAQSSSKMPNRVMVKGESLNLVYDQSRKSLDYQTVSGKHYSVYGGEEVVVAIPKSGTEEYFKSVADRAQGFMVSEDYIFHYVAPEEPWLREFSCAQYVINLYEYWFGKQKTASLGLSGNAWKMPKNIVSAGGKEIYNDKSGAAFDLNQLQAGDLIFMYYSKSKYKPGSTTPENLRLPANQRNTVAENFTHVAVFLGKKGNKYMISHLFHDVRTEDLASFLRSEKRSIILMRVLRPNQNILWKSSVSITPDLSDNGMIKDITLILSKRKNPDPRLWAEKIVQYETKNDPRMIAMILATLSKENGPFFISWKLECLASKVSSRSKTLGPISMNVNLARQVAKRVDGKDYTVDEMKQMLCDSGLLGLKYGIAYIDELISAYHRDNSPITQEQIEFVAADYNAGTFSSRNAALQKQISKLAGTNLELDGDFLIYPGDDPTNPSLQVSQSESAIRQVLSPQLTEQQIREDLKKEKTRDFENTQTYKLIKQKYTQQFGNPEFAIIPEIVVKAKIKFYASHTLQDYVKEHYSYYQSYCLDLSC